MSRTNHPAAICTDRFSPLYYLHCLTTKTSTQKEKNTSSTSISRMRITHDISVIAITFLMNQLEKSRRHIFVLVHHPIEYQSNFKRGKFCVQHFILSVRANMGDIKADEQNIYIFYGREQVGQTLDVVITGSFWAGGKEFLEWKCILY